MFYPPHCSIRHGPSTTSRARWRAGTQVCGSTVLITQEYSTSPPSSLRSTTAFARTALRTIPSVVTPGSCLWSSSASQSRSPVVNSIVFVFRFHLFNAVNILVYLQEELVPSCPRSVSQLSIGVQSAVQRGDRLGDYQTDLQCERSGALYVAKTTHF